MGAAAIFQTSHVYTDAELAAVRFEQTADVMVFAHLSHPLQRLRRYGNADWRWDDAPVGGSTAGPTSVTVTPVDGGGSGAIPQTYTYAVTGIDDTTGRETLVTVSNTVSNDLGIKGNYNAIVWTPISGATNYRVYAERSGAYGYIGATSGQTIFEDRNILPDYTDAPPQSVNPFADGANPGAVTFVESRLALGRTPSAPNAFFLSQTDDIFNFDRSQPSRATDAITASIRARRVNAIQHLVALPGLLALTNDAIFAITAAGEAITPETIRAQPQGYQGVGQCRPEAIVDVLFYVTSKGRVRTLGFTFEADGYRGNDITVFAPHLFSGFDIQEMAWCEHPSGVLWMKRSDGKLVALTWQAEQQVWGYTACETDGVVESVCSVSESRGDTLYAVVRRTVGETDYRYVERLAYPEWIDENWDDVEGAVVLDSCQTYEGEPLATFSNMAHLEGRSVVALADGYVIRDLVVTNGAVTLPDASSRVVIGLAYESLIRTLPVVAVAQNGTTKGRRQAVSSAIVEVLNTRGAEYGTGVDVGDEMTPFLTPDGLQEIYPEPLYTGLYDPSAFPSSKWTEALVTIRQRDPLPMVVLSIEPDIVSGG